MFTNVPSVTTENYPSLRNAKLKTQSALAASYRGARTAARSVALQGHRASAEMQVDALKSTEHRNCCSVGELQPFPMTRVPSSGRWVNRREKSRNSG